MVHPLHFKQFQSIKIKILIEIVSSFDMLKLILRKMPVIFLVSFLFSSRFLPLIACVSDLSKLETLSKMNLSNCLSNHHYLVNLISFCFQLYCNCILVYLVRLYSIYLLIHTRLFVMVFKKCTVYLLSMYLRVLSYTYSAGYLLKTPVFYVNNNYHSWAL